MTEKRLVIVNGMTGQETPVKVAEGATPADILGKLGLADCQLARIKDRQVLQPQSDLVRSVENGERMFAFSRMEVGGGRWDA
jgi:sulfur carrier protein ThiS